jgi:hypothetical protein
VSHAEEMLRRTKERIEHEVSLLSDDALLAAFHAARPWRQSIIRDEWRRRTFQRERRAEREAAKPKKSVWQWLREPAV